MKILFLEPPRRTWPYMNHEDNYLTKQSYLSLAACLRQSGFKKIEILDCMPHRIGWKTLGRLLLEKRPDVVAVGENHALYADEALKAFGLAKSVLPQVTTIAGGAHFSHLADACLSVPQTQRSSLAPPWMTVEPGLIDYIVKGEGELTLVELVRFLDGGGRDPDSIQGLAFSRDGEAVHTPPRPLIDDLDSLPLPAYDLPDMDLYGKASLLFSPGGTTVSHSRGCAHSCSFCVWWTQMARRSVDPQSGKERLAPCWRTRSPERTVEEIELLARRYRKKGLVFVDDCFNLDPNWNSRFARLLQESRLSVNWFAFMRADYLVRDHESGVLAELVRAGLSHVSIGAERLEDGELAAFGKRNYSADTTRRAFALLKKHYPSVFRQATFIVGLPEETRGSMLRQLEFARELDLDYPGFHPMTPVPGTPLWDETLKAGTLEAGRFDQFDWATPVVPSRHMTRRQIEETLIEMEKRYVTLPWLLRGLTSSSHYKRAMYLWFLKVSGRMALDLARSSLLRQSGPLVPLVTPRWYDQ